MLKYFRTIWDIIPHPHNTMDVITKFRGILRRVFRRVCLNNCRYTSWVQNNTLFGYIESSPPCTRYEYKDLFGREVKASLLTHLNFSVTDPFLWRKVWISQFMLFHSQLNQKRPPPKRSGSLTQRLCLLVEYSFVNAHNWRNKAVDHWHCWSSGVFQ